MDGTERQPPYRGAFPPHRMRGSAPGGTADTLRRVKKTSVYLEPDLDEALARRAADEGLTKAEFIRRTLAGAVQRPPRARLSVGVVRSGRADVSANVDRHLDETGFGEH